MANTNSSKGNPASKRMANLKLKARRARCWARGEVRKDLNRAVNHELHLERLANDGLGRRERRRVEAGLRTIKGGLGA